MQFYKACNQFQSNLFDNFYATNDGDDEDDEDNYEDDDDEDNYEVDDDEDNYEGDDDEDLDDAEDDDDDVEINLKNVEWEIGRRVCWNLSK